ncbi:MAG: RsmE family RNA methyltransferase [Vicinamibacteraceae bacterium]
MDRTPGSPLILDGAEGRHATRVLRLVPGDRAVLFDGAGAAVLAEVIGVRGERLELRVLEPHTSGAELPIAITIAPAVLKGDAMDTLIRDATMLGAAAIAPIVTARTVVPARASMAPTVVERWQRVALASAKQCGRSVLPSVAAARPLDAALRDTAWADATRIVLCEPEAAPGAAAADLPAVRGRVVILSGPEGGWTREEVAAATGLGWHPWTCSPLTLRAETAPIVALGILGWMSATPR